MLYFPLMRKSLAKVLVRWILRRLQDDPHSYNRLLGQAALMQLGRKPAEEFRKDLEHFYSQLDPIACQEDIDFASKVRQLDSSGAHKTDIVALRGDSSSDPDRSRFDIWARRFGLLRHLGIRQDVLILRAGVQVPPHGHCRVVSGFYLLTGQVAIRHYDCLERFEGGASLRLALDKTLGPGGFTTNSEQYHNVHWLAGLAPVSYLFRFTAVGIPGPSVFDSQFSNSRLYLDPSVPPDSSGIIRAPYINAEEAHRLSFFPAGRLTASN